MTSQDSHTSNEPLGTEGLDRPVPRDVVDECLNIALQAPAGFSMQRWRWLVITDPETRESIGDIFRRTEHSSLGILEEVAFYDREGQTSEEDS